MYVSFEAVSTQLIKKYLLRLVFAPSSFIMKSWSTDFLKIRKMVILFLGLTSGGFTGLMMQKQILTSEWPAKNPRKQGK